LLHCLPHPTCSFFGCSCVLRLVPCLFFHPSIDLLDLHSFPTRRSSDLHVPTLAAGPAARDRRIGRRVALPAAEAPLRYGGLEPLDRKSTRLNSSHQIISYAVFCFTRKKYHNCIPRNPPPSPASAYCYRV